MGGRCGCQKSSRDLICRRTRTSYILNGGNYMKKVLLILISILAILSTTPAYAGGGHGGGHAGGGYARGGGHGGGYYRGHDGGRYYVGGRYYGNYGGNFGWWWLGAPGLWYFTPGPYDAYPYYSYANPYIESNMPPVVVAPQTNAPPTTQAAQVWYYCVSAKGYYPYVPSCSEGWKSVPATPPQ